LTSNDGTWDDFKRELATALNAWVERLGPDRVLSGGSAAEAYGSNAIGAERRIPAAIRPADTDEVAAIVRVAAKHRIPLYPISTGRNWGYGSALPVADDCVVVDLSGLDRILDLDEELGLVTVQPGVTAGMLLDKLRERDLPWLVPVTGAGPHCSLLGNALERGYGITPHADHFGALTSLTAVLPDGVIYRPALRGLGGDLVDRVFKWGVGPYLDGLFTQSGFGIVTEATFVLAPRPSHVEGFLATVAVRRDLESAVLAVRDLLRELGGVIGSINLMNGQRMLSMFGDYPRDQVGSDGVLPRGAVDRLLAGHRMGPWTIGGVIYGHDRLAAAARRRIRERLDGSAKEVRFFTRRRIDRARSLLGRLPFGFARRLVPQLDRLAEGFKAAEGAPSDLALNLCYWKCGERPGDGRPLDPARDGCGLIWYSPLVPMKPDIVRTYVEMVTRTCPRHGIEPLITLTSLSAACFDSTVPLLFDGRSDDEAARARDCYRELFEGGRELGCVPYRVGVEHMGLVGGSDRLGAVLKTALDPDGILAPGRYGPGRAD